MFVNTVDFAYKRERKKREGERQLEEKRRRGRERGERRRQLAEALGLCRRHSCRRQLVATAALSAPHCRLFVSDQIGKTQLNEMLRMSYNRSLVVWQFVAPDPP